LRLETRQNVPHSRAVRLLGARRFCTSLRRRARGGSGRCRATRATTSHTGRPAPRCRGQARRGGGHSGTAIVLHPWWLPQLQPCVLSAALFAPGHRPEGKLAGATRGGAARRYRGRSKEVRGSAGGPQESLGAGHSVNPCPAPVHVLYPSALQQLQGGDTQHTTPVEEKTFGDTPHGWVVGIRVHTLIKPASYIVRETALFFKGPRPWSTAPVNPGAKTYRYATQASAQRISRSTWRISGSSRRMMPSNLSTWRRV
jgi:hypothetical protein